jgi:hypothetical protein
VHIPCGNPQVRRAKAHEFFEAFSARLKPCPFKTKLLQGSNQEKWLFTFPHPPKNK